MSKKITIKKVRKVRKVKVVRLVKTKQLQEGEGIADVFNSAQNFLLDKLTKRPLSITKLLALYGSNTITNIDVCRQPIFNIIRSALNVATQGDISKVVKDKGYDNVFHLYCILTLNNGVKIRLDKNQRVSIEINPKPINKDAVCKNAAVNNPTLNDFISKGEALGNKIGSFWRYSAHDNNCQKFIKALLDAQGNTSLDAFIMQDAGALVKPGFFRTIAQGITDAASIGDFIIKGGKKGKKCKDGCNDCHSCKNK